MLSCILLIAFSLLLAFARGANALTSDCRHSFISRDEIGGPGVWSIPGANAFLCCIRTRRGGVMGAGGTFRRTFLWPSWLSAASMFAWLG